MHRHKVYQQRDDDCMRACVATLFHLRHDDVPDLCQPDWLGVLRLWTRQFGYGVLSLELNGAELPPGLLIVAGPSQRLDGFDHAVIYLDGKLWHDPHPSGVGLRKVTSFDLFYRLDQPPVFLFGT